MVLLKVTSDGSRPCLSLVSHLAWGTRLPRLCLEAIPQAKPALLPSPTGFGSASVPGWLLCPCQRALLHAQHLEALLKARGLQAVETDGERIRVEEGPGFSLRVRAGSKEKESRMLNSLPSSAGLKNRNGIIISTKKIVFEAGAENCVKWAFSGCCLQL